MKHCILAMALLFAPSFVSAKVLIITHSYNRPDFIEMHYKSFSGLLLDDHEYVVFNDAPEESMKREIEQVCENLGIRCFRVPQNIHTINRPNIRHADCVNYSMQFLGFNHQGILFIIDSDMFLIRPLSIESYMKNLDIVAMLKGEGRAKAYLCPALTFLDFKKLPNIKTLNFSSGNHGEQVTDSGGGTYHYLKQYPALTIEEVNSIWSYQLFLGNSDIGRPVDNTTPDHVKIEHYESLGFRKNEIDFLLKKSDTFEFFFNLNFIHYHAGSNHDGKSAAYHAHKTKLFDELIESALVKGN